MMASGITSVAQRYENKCKFSTGAFLFTTANTRISVRISTIETAKFDTRRIVPGIVVFSARESSITSGSEAVQDAD